jgi:uncharacterized protein (TIGR02145 family)
MKKTVFCSSLVTMLLFLTMHLSAQVGINSDNSSPDPAAILDAKSSTKGFLPPRMTTTEMNAISSPPEGLMIYNTTLGTICWFNGFSWDIAANRDGLSCGVVYYLGKAYKTVSIGMQCWFAENLNVGSRINSGNQTNNLTLEKYCYNDLESNCGIYGGLYQWAEMVQYLNGATNTTSWNPIPTGPVQGICPPGWHLPSDADWTELTTYLGGLDLAGGEIKEAGTAHWTIPNAGATNSSGFTALPAGLTFENGVQTSLGLYGYFWSATENSSNIAWSRSVNGSSTVVARNAVAPFVKAAGLSVRCLKN